jgi:lysozyme
MTILFTRTKQSEDFRATPYLCPTGHVTIGSGCNLEAHPEHLAQWPDIQRQVRGGALKGAELVKELRRVGMAWTEAHADEVLRQQLDALTAVLTTVALPWLRDVDEARRGVVIEMAFQMGIGGLLKFKRFLTALRAGDYATAADEMMDSKWADQVGDGWGGRLDRAELLAKIIRTGAV